MGQSLNFIHLQFSGPNFRASIFELAYLALSRQAML